MILRPTSLRDSITVAVARSLFWTGVVTLVLVAGIRSGALGQP